MYSKTKRFSCFLLCFLILFMGFAGVFTTSARAEPITIATVSTIIWILGLMGISFASVEVARQASETIMWNAPDIMDMIDALPQGGGGDPPDPSAPNHKLLFNALSSANLLIIMERLRSIFSSDGEGEITHQNNDFVNVNLDDGTSFNGLFSSLKDPTYWGATFASSVDQYPNIVNIEGLSAWLNYDVFVGSHNNIYRDYKLHCAPNSSSYITYLLSSGTERNLASTYRYSIPNGSIGKRLGYGMGVHLRNGIYYALPVFGVEYVLNGQTFFQEAILNYDDYTHAIRLQGTPTTSIIQVPYKTEYDYTIPEIGQALQQKIAKEGDMVVTIPQATEETIKKTQEEIATDIQIKDLLEQIKDNTDPKPDEEVDIEKNKLPQELIYKFPFCVPFDLIDLVGALNAPSKVPKFIVPVKFDFINYEDEIVIDLSGWEKAAQVIRWGTTLFFILGLTMVTRKMIKG